MDFQTIVKKSILAGMLISFGCIFSMVVSPYGAIAKGICFSVGLFGVMCCDAYLFTGSILKIRKVWDKREEAIQLIIFWLQVWFWNCIGSLIMVVVAYILGYDSSSMAIVKASLPWYSVILRGILCNVMVCLSVYIYNRAKAFLGIASINAIASVILPVSCFVICGFEHSIANMFYMPLSFIYGGISLVTCISNILLATVGNLIGGIAFSWLIFEKREELW